MKCSGIILAAGEGKRAGSTLKQFIKLGGGDMITRVTTAMSQAAVFSEIIDVVPIGHTPGIEGGPTRIHSLLNGVQACKEDYIIFTDACRVYTPYWVFKEMFHMLGNIPIVVMQPEDDSVLHAGEMKWDNYPREVIRKIQTPNGFKKNLLIDLLESMIKRAYFFDSVISEYIRYYESPQFFRTEFFNPKITTASEIEHAKQFFGKE